MELRKRGFPLTTRILGFNGLCWRPFCRIRKWITDRHGKKRRNHTEFLRNGSGAKRLHDVIASARTNESPSCARGRANSYFRVVPSFSVPVRDPLYYDQIEPQTLRPDRTTDLCQSKRRVRVRSWPNSIPPGGWLSAHRSRRFRRAVATGRRAWPARSDHRRVRCCCGHNRAGPWPA